MTVISRYRTEEFYFIKLAPRSISKYTMNHRTGNTVIHNVQAGVAVYDDIFCIGIQNLCDQLFCFIDSIKRAIVSQIGSETAYQCSLACQDIHHRLRQIQLCFGRLTSGHIKFQSFFTKCFILLLQ